MTNTPPTHAALQAELDQVRHHLTDALQREAALHRFLDHSPAITYVKDLNGIFLLVNAACAAMVGRTPEQIIGQNERDLFPPEIVAVWQANKQQVLTRQQPLAFEERAPAADGTIHTYLSVRFPLYDAAGDIYATGGISSDITERKQMEEALSASEALLHAIYEVVDIGLCVTDAHGYFVRVNQAYCDIYQRTPAEVIGQHFTMMLPEETRAHAARVHDAFIAGAPESAGEWVGQRKDGALITILVTAGRLIQEDGQRFKVTTVTDITERKRAEDHLQQANLQLAHATRMKDEFLANMSHELRTPLNVILGLTEALQEEAYGTLNQKQQSLLQTIGESGRHLLTMINDILDLAKIEAGKEEITLAPLVVAEVCHACLRLIRYAAHKKGITITESLDTAVTTLQADERRLKQILMNVLSNAVKFTPPGGQVGLEVTGDANQQIIWFTIWDTGIGIAPEMMTHLFEPFVQAEGGLNRQYEGTGLGLALVARLTELHGGSVTVESTVGVGSRFTIALPWRLEMDAAPTVLPPETTVITPPAAQALPPHSDPPDPDAPCILLAEDNEATIQMVQGYLTLKGYQVVVARDGREALLRVAEQQPALILMDIQMPVMDGLTAMRHLRTDAACAHIPIIALTALAMPGDRERCLQAGATEYLSKPIRLAHLLQLIEASLAA